MMKRISILVVGGLLGGWAVFFFTPALVAAAGDNCAKCHLDKTRIDELTEELIAERQKVEVSERQEGEGYTVKKAPFDLFENVLVKEEFVQTVHGRIGCPQCHGGDAEGETLEAAHRGMVKDPTLNGAVAVCGGCHPDLARSGSRSSHGSLATSLAALQARCSPEQWRQLNQGAITHQCATCHESSCGSCHVSRPRVNGGGLMAGHLFQRRPDYLYQCGACHAQPIGDDFTGKISRGDLHYLKGMVCVDCHGGREVHAEAGQVSRHARPERSRCTDCHRDLAASTACRNELHGNRVDCTVCHAQEYQNCTSCHMGEDGENLAYSLVGDKYKGFKIGLNPEAGEGQPRFVLVRRIPVQADSFKHYLAEPLANFQTGPTYKRSGVHNIQRRTWQNAHCNHCHGQKSLFLTGADVAESERAANRKVLVAEEAIPPPIEDLPALPSEGPKRNQEMRVEAAWLHRHLGEPELLLLDVRLQKQYEEGHIPGARNLCECFLANDYKSKTPYLLKSPEELAKLLGEKIGLTPGQRVVIYDDGKNRAGVAFLALERIGQKQISFLDGNIAAWTRAGYGLVKGKTPEVADSGYRPQPREVLASSQYLKENKDKGGLILLDARNLSEYMGHTSRTDVSKRAGRIPGAASLPVKALLDATGTLKSPDELQWLFSQYGIHPGMAQTIVASCNTKSLASELYLVLRYLGYDNVKVHDGSWAEWSKLY